MSSKEVREYKTQIKRAYNKALKEKEFSKIKERIEKQRKAKELISNYEATH